VQNGIEIVSKLRKIEVCVRVNEHFKFWVLSFEFWVLSEARASRDRGVF